VRTKKLPDIHYFFAADERTSTRCCTNYLATADITDVYTIFLRLLHPSLGLLRRSSCFLRLGFSLLRHSITKDPYEHTPLICLSSLFHARATYGRAFGEAHVLIVHLELTLARALKKEVKIRVYAIAGTRREYVREQLTPFAFGDALQAFSCFAKRDHVSESLNEIDW
jgi:hypothetical protein